jgi:iron complex transport system ATP-binding protein
MLEDGGEGLLRVEGLRFGYGERAVLDGVGLEVGRGELVGLVGPNGSGKTTLLRLISGVLAASAGRVSVDDQDMAGLKASARARLVSVVPQNPQLPDGFTVRELVLMARNSHLKLLQWEGRGDLQMATRAMEATATLGLADRTLGAVSGGERQRALVAMALAQDAPVMLLDEPTSNLDLAHQTGIMDLVVGLMEERGTAVLVAMHDLTLAAQYCDRLVMLSEGRCYAEGLPLEVLTAEHIEAVYGAAVHLVPHPLGGTPVVLPARGAAKRSYH